jgi:hypothetical protein
MALPTSVKVSLRLPLNSLYLPALVPATFLWRRSSMYALRESFLTLFNYPICYHICLFLKLLLEDKGLSASLRIKMPKISSIKNKAVHNILCTLDFSLIFLPCFSAIMDHLCRSQWLRGLRRRSAAFRQFRS